MPLQLDYFYGGEADQYSFYRIPKTLFTDARYSALSVEARVLYGLMLDRMGLSVRSGWLDSQGRVYIYFTQDDVIDKLNFGHNKVGRLFRELEDIGLIERKKQGQGKPARIYVKNFVLPPDGPEETGQNPLSPACSKQGRRPCAAKECPDIETVPATRLAAAPVSDMPSASSAASPLPVPTGERGPIREPEQGPEEPVPDWQKAPTREPYRPFAPVREPPMPQTSPFGMSALPHLTVYEPGDEGQTTRMGRPDCPFPEVLTSSFGKSAPPKTGGQDSPIWDAIKTDRSKTEWSETEGIKTEKNETEFSLANLSHPSYPPAPAKSRYRLTERADNSMDSMEAYRKLILENIDYDFLLMYHAADQAVIDGYVELMLEICCTRRKTVRINREDLPVSLVRGRLLKLNAQHIEYVLECMGKNTTRIGNIKAYTLSALYNAPSTMEQYYTALVNHDMACPAG